MWQYTRGRKAIDDTAPHPAPLLKGSLVSPSLEAAVLNAKYVNGMPLYRQERSLSGMGYGLPPGHGELDDPVRGTLSVHLVMTTCTKSSMIPMYCRRMRRQCW